MQRIASVLLSSILITVLFSGTAVALSFIPDIHVLGEEITVNDGIASRGAQLGPYGEDDEVEHHSALGQNWDFQGMFWNGAELSIVAGFDFEHGEWGAGNHYSAGDLFVGPEFNMEDRYIDRTAKFVFDFEREANGDDSDLKDSGRFDIIKGGFNYIGTTSTHVPESNPYLYEDDGQDVGDGYYEISEIDVGNYFSNWNSSSSIHYVLRMWADDAAFFASILDGGLLHMTLECGNDTVRGQTAVPEPATLLLLGIGLIGLAGVGRKRFKN